VGHGLEWQAEITLNYSINASINHYGQIEDSGLAYGARSHNIGTVLPVLTTR
jgi:hypothetical protein